MDELDCLIFSKLESFETSTALDQVTNTPKIFKSVHQLRILVLTRLCRRSDRQEGFEV